MNAEIMVREVRQMAYDIKKDKYADFTDKVVHHFGASFNIYFRGPGMKKRLNYMPDLETGVNMDPSVKFVDPRMINSRTLNYWLDPKDLCWFLPYAAKYTLNFPGSKFWMNDNKITGDFALELDRRRRDWKESHPREYYYPDWWLDDEDNYCIMGVCENGIWRISEKYCGAVELLFPGGMPKYCRAA
jgi:hypothetical protein